MARLTDNQGYQDAENYSQDPDNVEAPNALFQEYLQGLNSFSLAELGDVITDITNVLALVPTVDQKAAMDNANSPDALNPFGTLADISGGSGGAGVMGRLYTFKTDTDPGTLVAGEAKLNNADPNLATEAYVHNIDAEGVNWSQVYLGLRANDEYVLQEKTDGANSYRYVVSADPSQTGGAGPSGYVTIPVAVGNIAGTLANDDSVLAAALYIGGNQNFLEKTENLADLNSYLIALQNLGFSDLATGNPGEVPSLNGSKTGFNWSAAAGGITIPSGQEFPADANDPNGTVVGSVVATGWTDSAVWSIISGNPGGDGFAIDDNGEITIADNTELTNGVGETLTIQILDGANSAIGTVDIDVRAFLKFDPSVQSFSANDNDPNGTSLGFVTTSGGQGTKTWSILTDPTAGGYEIVSSTGELKILDAAKVTVGVDALEFQVVDDLDTISDTFNVTVSSLTDWSTIVSAAVTNSPIASFGARHDASFMDNDNLVVVDGSDTSGQTTVRIVQGTSDWSSIAQGTKIVLSASNSLVLSALGISSTLCVAYARDSGGTQYLRSYTRSGTTLTLADTAATTTLTGIGNAANRVKLVKVRSDYLAVIWDDSGVTKALGFSIDGSGNFTERNAVTVPSTVGCDGCTGCALEEADTFLAVGFDGGTSKTWYNVITVNGSNQLVVGGASREETSNGFGRDEWPVFVFSQGAGRFMSWGSEDDKANSFPYAGQVISAPDRTATTTTGATGQQDCGASDVDDPDMMMLVKNDPTGNNLEVEVYDFGANPVSSESNVLTLTETINSLGSLRISAVKVNSGTGVLLMRNQTNEDLYINLIET